MKLPRALHRWDLSIQRAIALQKELADRVVEAPLREMPRLIAGGDCAFADGGREIVAAWVVWDRVTRMVVEQQVVRRAVRFPYVPGLLSFREAPALLAAARRIRCGPQLFLVDGQGRAHPRGCGLACHLGVWLDRPTIGCAKSRLCGSYDLDAVKKGRTMPLHLEGRIVGRVVPPSPGRHPLYVSVGNKVTLDDAVKVVRAARITGRMTEPIRLADQLVAETRES